MRKIKFISDFATRSKGETWEDCPSMLASELVNIEKVAVYVDETPSQEDPKPKTKAKSATN
jgi:hypothetical protein